MKRQGKRPVNMTLIISIFVVLMALSLLTQQTWNLRRNLSLDSISETQQVSPYAQRDIQSLIFNVRDAELMLLVFNGKRFQAYTVGHWSLSYRYVKIVPLLVHALKTNNPERFQPDQPVFQMVFSVYDCIKTVCANHPDRCPINKMFPPIVSFPTAYRNDAVLPTAKAFPNPIYTGCLYDWKLKRKSRCKWQKVDQSLKFEDLRNQIVWRGSDFSVLGWMYEYGYMNTKWMKEEFTDDALATTTPTNVIARMLNRFWFLTPRWKAVALTLNETMTHNVTSSESWINALFTGDAEEDLHSRFEKIGIPVVDHQSMDGVAMSKYKYQIDLAGGGGTTWQGTLTKLLMPGVLFHHETATLDWFYDLMEPWVHYIPIRTDLGNLREQYEWAEANPEKVKKIAEESTKLAEYLLNSEYMDTVYEELFVDYLGEVVKAYNPEGRSWEDCMKQYRMLRFPVQLVSDCNLETCKTQWDPGSYISGFKHSKTSIGEQANS